MGADLDLRVGLVHDLLRHDSVHRHDWLSGLEAGVSGVCWSLVSHVAVSLSLEEAIGGSYSKRTELRTWKDNACLQPLRLSRRSYAEQQLLS